MQLVHFLECEEDTLLGARGTLLDQFSSCSSGCVHSGLLSAEPHGRKSMAWWVLGFRIIRFIFVLYFKTLLVSYGVEWRAGVINNNLESLKANGCGLMEVCAAFVWRD
jgi:hypothetical protein